MDFDYSKLNNLKSLEPAAVQQHIDKLSKHEGPGFLKVAAAKTLGFIAGAGAEAFLGVVVAPLTLAIPGVGEAAAPLIEMAAPFAAVKFGGWVEDKAKAWFTKPKAAADDAAPSRPGFFTRAKEKVAGLVSLPSQPELALNNG